MEHRDGVFMMKIFQRLRDSGLAGDTAASLILVWAHITLWPIYPWLRRVSDPSGHPMFLLCVCYLFFAAWVGLVALLWGRGKRYPLLVVDALCGGAAVTIASVLHATDGLLSWSKGECVSAAWVLYLGAMWLVIHNAAQERKSRISPNSRPK
jgi:hypothetical protein